MNKIKLEVGKYYRTRSGRRAQIREFNIDKEDHYPFIGEVLIDNALTGGVTWTREGKYYRHAESSEYDLVADWEDGDEDVSPELRQAIATIKRLAGGKKESIFCPHCGGTGKI